jgi:nudix-type nucleoside diphosphatase (YffH/AdpP family)
MKRVEILSRRRLLDDFFKVDEVLLRHERLDGSMSQTARRLTLERGDGEAALLYRPGSHRLVLVRQFRYPTCARGPGWLLEVVAGILGGDESPETAMRREIAEETGYAVATLRLISIFYLSPGGSSERIYLYFGEIDEAAPRGAGGGLAEEAEEIEVVELTAAQAWQALDNGGIVDAKTLIALMWLRQRLADGQASSR